MFEILDWYHSTLVVLTYKKKNLSIFLIIIIETVESSKSCLVKEFDLWSA
jgi:hypothetical protein